MVFSLLLLFAKIMCLMLEERLWARLVRNQPQLTGRCCHVTSRIISVCRITPPWTVTLSDLSLCNSPACHSQVHCISNAQVMRGWDRRQWMIKVRGADTGRLRKKMARHKWKKYMYGQHTCVFIIEWGTGVRRGGGIAVFPWLSIANAVFTFYGICPTATFCPAAFKGNSLFLKGRTVCFSPHWCWKQSATAVVSNSPKVTLSCRCLHSWFN